MASITKRKGKKGITYLAQIRLKGHQPASATFRRKADADKWVKITEAEIIEGRYIKHKESAKRTLGDLIERYKKWPKFLEKKDQANRGRLLNFWTEQLGGRTIAQIDADVIDSIRNELSEPDENGKVRAPATVNRYLAALSHLFSYGVSIKWADENPVRAVKRAAENNKRTRYLDSDERAALLRACKDIDSTLYLIVVLALSTGARRAEIAGNREKEKQDGRLGNYCGLRWGDINWEDNFAILSNTKNKDQRTIQLTGLALALMKEHRKVRRMDSDLVFPDPKNPAMPWGFEPLWRRAVVAAEITDFKFHDLRHSFATACLANGATLPELMHLLGHKSPAMVARYAHMEKTHASSIVERMNAAVFG